MSCKSCSYDDTIDYKNQKCIFCYLIFDYRLEYDDIYVFVKNNMKLSSLMLKLFKDIELDFDDEDSEHLISMYDDYDKSIIGNPIFRVIKEGFKNKDSTELHKRLKMKSKEFYFLLVQELSEHTDLIDKLDVDFIDQKYIMDLKKYFYNNREILKDIDSIINYYIENINIFIRDCKKFKSCMFNILVCKSSLNSYILTIMLIMKKFDLISISYEIMELIDNDYYRKKEKESLMENDKNKKRFNTVMHILKIKNESILNDDFFEKVYKKEFQKEVYSIKYEFDKIKEVKDFIINDDQFMSPLKCNIILENINKLQNETYDVNKKYTLTDDQINCIKMILDNKVSVVTGGPGTGKSTLVSFLVSCESSYSDLKCCILTPTGKATARMKNDIVINKKWTDPQIYTIHSFFYKVTKSNQLVDFNMIIIDESSMLSNKHINFIKNILQKNRQQNYHIVFIGDDAQLPPIGLGDIFYNLIRDEKVKKYELLKNHRSEDDIIKVLNMVKNENRLYLDDDFFNKSKNVIVMEHEKFISSLQNIYHSNKDTQLLSWKQYKNNQTESIKNTIFNSIQKFYKGKNSNHLERHDRIYNKKNIYFKNYNIMNGFTGEIEEVLKTPCGIELYYIRFESTIKIGDTYDDKESSQKEKTMIYYNYYKDKYMKTDKEYDIFIKYILEKIYPIYLYDYIEVEELEKWLMECKVYKNLEFSYYMTVHKYQGSECDSIIYYIDNSEIYFGIDKKLVYTALSRAKNNLYIVYHKTNKNSILKLNEYNNLLHHNDVF